MINVILPVVDQPENYLKFVERIACKDVKVFVGLKEGVDFVLPKVEEKKTAKKSTKKTTKNTKTKKKSQKKLQDFVELHLFSEKSNTEEIINSLHSCKMQEGQILVCRRPLSEEEFLRLTTSKCQIATLKAKHSKFFNMLKNFTKAIVKRFFAFTFFEDISAICYSQSMFQLMSVCANLSMASRINKYVGIEIEEIETTEKQVKKQYSRFKNLLFFMFWTLIFAGSLTGGVLVCVFTETKALIVILVLFWIFLALFLWFVEFVNFIRTLAVGNLRYGRAQEVVS